MRQLRPFLLALSIAVSSPALATDIRTGFRDAIALSAEIRSLEAQRGVVDARRGGADAFLPGAPVVSGSWRTTTITPRRGYQEFEVGGEIPLWLPGEARALRGTAEAQGVQLEARVAQARLALAGEVRDAYWSWAAAVAEREAANARVAAARALERDLGRQVGAGNAPRSDLLLATADLREAEAALRTAIGAIRDTSLAFRALTGSDPTSGRPETPAPPPTGDATLASLPAAAVARAARETAAAEERLARIRERANPTLFAGWRREREATGEPYVDRPVVGIRIPFGYTPLREERVATARAEATAAEATLATTARTLAAADRRARGQAEDAAALATLAEARHRALAEQAGLSEAAYRAGNLAFAEVVRVRAGLAAADAARRRARVESGRAASQINQVLGQEPPLMRRLVLALLTLLPLALPVRAHEGHDHGDEPTAVAAALPRAETHSEAFEIVAVLGPGGVLTIYLDRWGDNAPVDGAVTLTLDDEEIPAERQGIGLFVARHPKLAQPGERNLVFSVAAGEEMDLLTATLTVPAPPSAAPAGTGLLGIVSALPVQLGIGGLLLLTGIALGRASVRRPLPPMVEEDAPATIIPAASPPVVPLTRREREVASVALALLLLAAPAVAQAPSEAPRRLEDGAIFVPKNSQRLLSIRTSVAELGEASASLGMVGTLVPDPGSSGRVQPSQTGRLVAGERGLPTLGQRVEQGQVLAYVTPAYGAAERGQLAQNAAELDAQIGILEARVNRLRGLRGSVSDREISDAAAELAGARQRRAAIQPALGGREPLVAPVSGVVSVVRAAIGQIVDTQTAVFEVVDPSRLWVEALAFDRAAVDRVTGASATLTDGRVVELELVGRGLAVRQGAVPVNFRVREPPGDAPIGSPVVVTVRTARAVPGVVLPAEAVVRSPEGPPVVYEHASAERFVPRQVRAQPLDGARVVVTAGLESGRRVVVQGAGLIAQVR